MTRNDEVSAPLLAQLARVQHGLGLMSHINWPKVPLTQNCPMYAVSYYQSLRV